MRLLIRLLLPLAFDLLLDATGLGTLSNYAQFLAEAHAEVLPNLGHLPPPCLAIALKPFDLSCLSLITSDLGSDLGSVCIIRTPHTVKQLLRTVKNLNGSKFRSSSEHGTHTTQATR